MDELLELGLLEMAAIGFELFLAEHVQFVQGKKAVAPVPVGIEHAIDHLDELGSCNNLLEPDNVQRVFPLSSSNR